MKIEMWATDRPKPYPRNARKITQKAIDKVRLSIREFGFRQPIVVEPNEVIIVGHVRQLAAQQEGLREVPVHIEDGETFDSVAASRKRDAA